MKIRNTTKGDLGLDFETIVPAGGVLDIDKDRAEAFAKSRIVQGWFEDGKLVEVKEKPAKVDNKPDEKKKAD